VPIYEYRCMQCHTKFEKFVRSLADPAEIRCPHCGSVAVKKGWSLFGMGKGDDSAASVSAPSLAGCDTGGT